MLFARMDADQAEIVATLYAIWNDLLQSSTQTTDDAIIADFYGWHEDKSRFPEDRLRRALDWMRTEGLVPSGAGEPVAAV